MNDTPTRISQRRILTAAPLIYSMFVAINTVNAQTEHHLRLALINDVDEVRITPLVDRNDSDIPPAPVFGEDSATKPAPQQAKNDTPHVRLVVLRVDQAGVLQVLESRTAETEIKHPITKRVIDKKTGQIRETEHVITQTVRSRQLQPIQLPGCRLMRVSGERVPADSLKRRGDVPALMVVGGSLSEKHRKLLRPDSLLVSVSDRETKPAK